ncbi:PREDICTED: uncharacterized protein LOC108754348 [Trachymyrmex septentrionalis]|uniref:uncharacterized protein LOC108754348 n=1 Tax=Trachymyrmex septentrionalis TaxID=34720 RepID=UPI00084F5F4E|nr:PREDICTED: uncharacterized protein LOC108754348 [Trachymyrmex septentrionalis]
MTRAHSGLTYRITQVIVGHGCFEAYLYEIRRTESPIYQHCKAAIDNAYPPPLSLVGCGEGELVSGSQIGFRFGPRVRSGDWAPPKSASAFARYCETVMRAKKAERDRERDQRARVVHPPVLPSLLRDSDSS